MLKTTDEDRRHGFNRRMERGSCQQCSWYSFLQILSELLG